MSSDPTANITVKRNRVKHYGSTVYLKNQTHFEIELFNPKLDKVLAKIFLNGRPISTSGIVIQPGQRVFLERWLDEPNKFLFKTYTVDSSPEAQAAMKKNGEVRVEFYDQYFTYFNQTVTYCTNSSDWSPDLVFAGTTINYLSSYATSEVGENSTLSTSVKCVMTDSVETGRTEIGETSNQRFGTDSSVYSAQASTIIDLKILPESAKPIEIEQIRLYCHECGTRMKNQSWKFCPTCGTKIE